MNLNRHVSFKFPNNVKIIRTVLNLSDQRLKDMLLYLITQFKETV